MKLVTSILGFLLFLFFIEYINSDQFISVILQKCYGSCNKKYCNFTVRCRPLNRTSKLVIMDLYIHPGLTVGDPINIEIIAYKKFRTEYRQHMVRAKIELCGQLNKMDHPLLSYFSRYWKYSGNFFDPCPISGRRYVKPYVSNNNYSPLVPAGEWKIDYILSKSTNNSEEFLASWSDFYEIKPTSSVEF